MNCLTCSSAFSARVHIRPVTDSVCHVELCSEETRRRNVKVSSLFENLPMGSIKYIYVYILHNIEHCRYAYILHNIYYMYILYMILYVYMYYMIYDTICIVFHLPLLFLCLYLASFFFIQNQQLLSVQAHCFPHLTCRTAER